MKPIDRAFRNFATRCPMGKLIVEWNIKRYALLLQYEQDEARKKTIAKLLAEEKAKLASLSD